MIRFLCILFTIIICAGVSHAQTNNEQNSSVVEGATENSSEETNESEQNEIPEELMDLFNHPLNLNKDNLEIFVRYNLITQTQCTSLEDYRKRMGSLVELEELQQVDGFDKKTIQNIIPYCKIISSKTEQGSHQITFRFQRSLNKSVENYPGSNAKILFRYRAAISPSLNISFTGEKDAGEEIFTRQKKGFDFNSFNICFKGKSFLKKVIAGDYNIEYGQGLTAWTGLSFGSGSNIIGIYKYGRGIMPYSGTDENRFLRGIAAGFQNNKIRCDIWISYHSIDGNKITDTLSNVEFISSLQTSGYHRTFSEIQDHHSQQETAYGTSITYSSGNLTTGLVTSIQHFSIPIKNSNRAYAKYEFTGRDNLNMGLNYSYTFKNILLFGEGAYNRKNSFAFLNGALMSIDPRFSIGLLWRSYARNYTDLKSNAFGVNTNNSNEQGNYFGIIYKITRSITFSGYTDIYSFPFIKYRTDKPSRGSDFFHQLEFTPTKKFTGQLRYRKRLKQLNDEVLNSGLNPISDLSFNSLRLSARFKIDNAWEYSFRVERSSENKNGKRIGYGTLVSQDLFFHPMGKPYSANCRYAIYNCPQFDTRIYEYENDVQGAFSIPFYYGTGSRFYSNLNYKISGGITFSLRYAISWIDDTVPSSEKSEVKLQVKAIFK